MVLSPFSRILLQEQGPALDHYVSKGFTHWCQIEPKVYCPRPHIYSSDGLTAKGNADSMFASLFQAVRDTPSMAELAENEAGSLLAFHLVSSQIPPPPPTGDIRCFSSTDAIATSSSGVPS